MRITFDREANAVYIRLRDGKVRRTAEYRPYVLVDFGYNSEILGVEILLDEAMTELLKKGLETLVEALRKA